MMNRIWCVSYWISISVVFFLNHEISFLSFLKDELLGLAETSETNPAFKNHGLNMDVLYRTGETQQVNVAEIFMLAHFGSSTFIFEMPSLIPQISY